MNMMGSNAMGASEPKMPTEIIQTPSADAAPDMPSTNTNMQMADKPKKSFLGMDLRSVLAVSGLALFFVLSMAGVLIALRQRQVAVVTDTGTTVVQPVAPNAPTSQPAAAVTQQTNCTLTFEVGSTPTPTPTATPSATPSPTPSGTPTPTPSVTPSPSPDLVCNSECDSNADCQDVDTDYICYSGQCRLDENPGNDKCEPEEQEEARVNCNEACTANSDCTNSAQICFNGACRLETNPSSETCTLPSSSQPTIPAELPQSGSEDILNWLKAGLGVLGIGTVLLLLL